MLRNDGPGLQTSDFRNAPRARISTKTAAAMPPPRGVVPPRLGDEQAAIPSPRLKPGNTGAFMAQVAVELMQEEAQGSTVSDGPIAKDASSGDSAVGRPAAAVAAASGADLGMAASARPLGPTEAAAATESDPRRRGVLLGFALVGGVLVLTVIGWCAVRSPTPPVPSVASAPAPAVTESPPSATPPVAPVPTGLVAGSSTGSSDATTTTQRDDGFASEASGDGSTGAGESSSTADAEESTTSADTDTGTDADAELIARAPSARRSSRAKRKTQSRPAASPQAPSRPAPPKTAPPADASALLAQARTAYNKGQGSTAYSLASKSHRRKSSGPAAELMVLSACAMKQASKAKAALKKVPLLRRGSVRSKCKSKHGLRLGL